LYIEKEEDQDGKKEKKGSKKEKKII